MRRKIITAAEANQRLDKFLRKYLPQAGNGFIYKMLRKKNITLNGKKALGREKIAIGDEIAFYIAEETLDKFQTGPEGVENYYQAFRQLGELRVLFENAHLIIVDKPAGVLCQKAKADDVSLNEWLSGYLLSGGQITQESLKTFKPAVLNRLDRNTSGIVLCGKSLAGSQEISRLIKNKRIRKFYQLYVKGEVAKAGELRGYHYKDEKFNKVQINNEEGPLLTNSVNIETEMNSGGSAKEKPVITRYRPLASSSERTLLEAELITGKTHQIRAQFAAAGHPLLGDYKYGERKVNDEYKRLYDVESQLLHAYKVIFPPMRGDFADLSGLLIISEPPEAFKLKCCK